MRKIVLFISTLLLCCSANAQRSKFTQEVSVGVNGGLNFSEVSFLHNNKNSHSKYLGSSSMRQGLKAGIAGRYIAQKHFGIQLEANYLQAGWKEKFKEETILKGTDVQGLSLEREIDYIEVPFLAHIYFGKKFRYYFNLGPKLAFLTSFKELESNQDFDKETFKINDMEDPRMEDDPYYRKVDYGVSIGLGFEYPIGKTKLGVEGRYGFGFEDIFPNSKSDLYQRSNNQMLSITMSLMVPVLEFKR